MKLLFNARIYTQDSSCPSGTAILIDHERVLAVGEKDELLASAHGRIDRQNMEGRTILPGLTDAHLHMQNYALGLQKVDCDTDTKEECLQRIAVRAQKARRGEWILGHGWNQNNWFASPADIKTGEAGVIWPSARDLDAVTQGNPAYLTAKSLHAAWANSEALKLANVTSNTPDPRDGQIQRNASGRPTGILLESAMSLVSDIVPKPSLEQVATAIEKAQPILWKFGLTGIHDFDRRDSFMALQSLHAQGKLKLRVNKNIPVESLEHACELGLRTGFGDDWLWIGSVKAFMDGALGPRTAAMFHPYLGEPANYGILNMDGEELFEHARRAADAGLSMTVHAIGDRANHEVLNAYEQLRTYEKAKGLPHLRHRIEHVQVLHAGDVPRLAQLDVIASMQPLHATSDMFMADRYWGERAALAYAWRAQLNHGARLVFGSDAPVESPNPFWGLHAAVTRRRAEAAASDAGWYPEQKLALPEALTAYTTGAAYAANAEHRLGRLAPGYLADLIVLEQDIFNCEPDTLLSLESSETMIGGEWVHTQ